MDNNVLKSNLDNTKLVNAMQQLKKVGTVIFKEEFYKAVVEALLYVPISVEGEKDGKKEGKYCVAATADGERYLCAFTSKEELEKCYGDRKDIVGTIQNFAVLREIILEESNSLTGLLFDPEGENVAIPKQEMMPAKL